MRDRRQIPLIAFLPFHDHVVLGQGLGDVGLGELGLLLLPFVSTAFLGFAAVARWPPAPLLSSRWRDASPWRWLVALPWRWLIALPWRWLAWSLVALAGLLALTARVAVAFVRGTAGVGRASTGVL